MIVMQSMKKVFALAVSALATLVAQTTVGDTFYVATDGNDGADGSSETPFATIAAGVTAAAASSAPRKVIVRTGEYKIDTVIEITAIMTIERLFRRRKAACLLQGLGES